MARVDSSFLSRDTFASVSEMHPATGKSLQDKFGYSAMSKVQALTIPIALRGDDVIAKAQTGTGKTIAFLVPIIQRAATRNAGLSALILAPTRELAIQIHGEAVALLTFHAGLQTAVVVGGTSMGKDQKALSARVDILIATPGRLLDHLANTKGAATLVGGIDTLALDEADRMLDMGFRPDLERILSFVKNQHQTLLFSATIAPEVIQLAPLLLRETFWFVDAGTGKQTLSSTNKSKGAALLIADDPFATASQVVQHLTIVEQDAMAGEVVNVVLTERQKKNHKVMVFFTTARLTQLFAELMAALGCPVLEIHSRKSQKHRQTTSDKFRDATNVVMFSSDVTARGMDYPDVTMVLQVGQPSSGEQYVHRLGRTGRAGMEGRGLLILMPEERFFLKQIERLTLVPTKPVTRLIDDQVILRAIEGLPTETKAAAYSAWLGFYNSSCSKMKWSKEYLVQRANQFAVQCLGLSQPPALQKKTIGKMGLKGVAGLVIDHEGKPQSHRFEQATPVVQQSGPLPIGQGQGQGRGRGRGRGRGQYSAAAAPPQHPVGARLEPQIQRHRAETPQLVSGVVNTANKSDSRGRGRDSVPPQNAQPRRSENDGSVRGQGNGNGNVHANVQPSAAPQRGGAQPSAAPQRGGAQPSAAPQRGGSGQPTGTSQRGGYRGRN
jgi:ATP-dependent RNA helicase MSS116